MAPDSRWADDERYLSETLYQETVRGHPSSRACERRPSLPKADDSLFVKIPSPRSVFFFFFASLFGTTGTVQKRASKCDLATWWNVVHVLRKETGTPEPANWRIHWSKLDCAH